MAHIHRIYDSDLHFIIDPVTREVKSDLVKKSTLVQHDHNSERLTFELPRHVEGHDMSLCDRVSVHFTNSDKTGKNQSADMYTVDDVQVSPDDEDVVIFSWLVSRAATAHAGTLKFSITFECMTDTEVDYSWSTLIFSNVTVSARLNNAAGAVEPYSDVIEAIKAEVSASAAEEAGTAATNAIKERFAREVWEDENMNLYSGDCHPNNGANGVDTVTGKCNALLNSGGGNNITSDHNLVSGALNTVDAENCINVGLGNWNKVVEKTVDGKKHTYGHRSATFGRYLISSANDQLWAGRWNVQKDSVLFGIGNGAADDKRSNAFMVYSAGTAAVGKDPVGNMDVVTKQYCDNKIKEALASAGGADLYEMAFAQNGSQTAGLGVEVIGGSGNADIAFLYLDPYTKLTDYDFTTCWVSLTDVSTTVRARTLFRTDNTIILVREHDSAGDFTAFLEYLRSDTNQGGPVSYIALETDYDPRHRE